MTTAKNPEAGSRFLLPDPPERKANDMTSAEHLSETGLHHHLKQFLGNGVNPAAYGEDNGYIISEQGKPPGLVLEIASEATGHIDIGEKWEFYESLGIPEY